MRTTVIAAVLFALGVAGPSAYLLADRIQPYEYLSGEVLPPDPKMGGQVSVHWRVKVNRFCHGWVQRNITDQRGYVWHNAGTPVKDLYWVKPGDLADIVNTFELPRQLGAGPTTYQAHVEYRCNWLQKLVWPIRVATPVLHFDVLP